MQDGVFRGFSVERLERGVALVEFNRPERLNGMAMPVKRDLVEILTQAQMDDSVRVIVFTGQGRAFSAGDDISGKTTDLAGRGLVPEINRGHHNHLGTYNGLRWISQALNRTVRSLDKLTVAALNGVAIQTGLSLALCCDFRIASSEARLGSGTLRFGLLPDEGGQYLIVRLLGVAKAMDFFMRNRILSATEALELGLVHEVVEPDELRARSLELAAELASGPQVAMRLLKRSIYNAADLPWEAALDEIAAKTPMADYHADADEGVAAFRQKRQPRFNDWLESDDS